MQLDFLFRPVKSRVQPPAVLQINSQAVPIHFIRNRNARRYIIRVQPDGSVRATVPRLGSDKEARAFAERNTGWIAKQLQNRQLNPAHPPTWQAGTEILYRGEIVKVSVTTNQAGQFVHVADQSWPIPHTGNLRPAIERRLRALATSELTTQTLQLAQIHGLTVTRVTIRNQRSRWGSCSRRGTISLNWRLIQMPDSVREYVIIHELMHLREMNHTRQFWHLVEQHCPHCKTAKLWIKQHRNLLR